jgi:hypothetical protein
MGHHHHQQQQQYEEMSMQELNYRSSNYYLHTDTTRGRSRGAGDNQELMDTDNPTAVRSHSMRSSSGMSPVATNRWRSRTESEGRPGGGGGGSSRRSRDRSSSSSGAMLYHRGGGGGYGMDNGGGGTPKISDFFADTRYFIKNLSKKG